MMIVYIYRYRTSPEQRDLFAVLNKHMNARDAHDEIVRQNKNSQYGEYAIENFCLVEYLGKTETNDEA